MRTQISNNRKSSNNDQSPAINEERDFELENVVGNLMIAQYQVDRLRSRLSERIAGYGSGENKKICVIDMTHNISLRSSGVHCVLETIYNIQNSKVKVEKFIARGDYILTRSPTLRCYNP